jgi:hypothetical protein
VKVSSRLGLTGGEHALHGQGSSTLRLDEDTHRGRRTGALHLDMDLKRREGGDGGSVDSAGQVMPHLTEEIDAAGVLIDVDRGHAAQGEQALRLLRGRLSQEAILQQQPQGDALPVEWGAGMECVAVHEHGGDLHRPQEAARRVAGGDRVLDWGVAQVQVSVRGHAPRSHPQRLALKALTGEGTHVELVAQGQRAVEHRRRQ